MTGEGQGSKIHGLTRAAWAELGVTNPDDPRPPLSEKRVLPPKLSPDAQAKANDKVLGVRPRTRSSRP